MKVYTPPFAQTNKTATAIATVATTINTDTPTNAVLLLNGGTEGALLTSLTAMPRATVSASSLVLFLSKDGGVTKRLIDSEVMPAQTVNTTTAVNEINFARYSEMVPGRLEAGDSLYVGSQVAAASGIVFKAEYMLFEEKDAV